MTKVYTTDEVSRHDKKDDLWIVMHGGVYDLTSFLMEHPGGEEVLLNLAGEDGSACFDEIGHSDEAIQLRQQFKIGEIAAGSSTGTEKAPETKTVPETSAEERTVDDDDWEYQEIKEEKSPWLMYIIAAGVLIYGLIFYYILYS